MSIVTLTTDLGSTPTAGLLSGVIWRTAPNTRLVELTHEIPVWDVLWAQVVLESAIPYFPDGTIHLAVTSRKVGERPRPIAAKLGPMLFVGPDNGLITPLLERAEANRWTTEIYHTAQPQDQMVAVGYDHLGFAALAAQLAAGVPLSGLGERINDPLRASIPAPEMVKDGWRGQVLQVDYFGNLTVNIRRAHLEGMGLVEVLVSGQVIDGLSRTFGDGQPGELIAIIDSSNRLSICVVNDSAAARLNAHPGDIVEVQPHRGR